jgi:hypothetical protein
MNYNQNFIRECEELYKKIQQNDSIQECLNNAAAAAAAAAATTAGNSTIDIYEPLWFVYYMFFAIHNPKMEDYIQKKSASTTVVGRRNHVDIIKNMLKRRNYSSTIVFQLYTHAYTNQGNVSYIYPKYKNDITAQLIKSFQDNRLKTTAVLLRKQWGTASTDVLSAFVEYIITTQPTITQPAITQPAITQPTITQPAITQPATPHQSNEVPVLPEKSGELSVASIVGGRIPPLNKINNDINYKRKDLILLALVCYMKVDEVDINKKNIFISATDEELKAAGDGGIA